MRCATALGLLLIAAPAPAQNIFSPGELSAPHVELEGLENCLRCHSRGEEVSQAKCMECHTEIERSINAKEGFHGRLAPAERACDSCHKEHMGRQHKLFPASWDKDFDHREKTGFPLRGQHAKIECKDCHETRRILDPNVLDLLRKHPERKTFMGLGDRCIDCHFDEHRGQEGPKCQTCHDERAWKPAPSFDHSDTDYPLEGKHKDVACADCHPKIKDEKTPPTAFPAPVKRTFFKYDDIPHATCLNCHEDPHDGEFGDNCESCHTVRGWKILKVGAQDTGFHDKTRFPLRGAHTGVECRDCHGPFPGQPAVFRGLPFKSCTPCHVDAHVGQLPRAKDKEATGPACEDCHTVNGFLPPRFDINDHKKTRYPLEEAHAVVACNLCHTKDPGLDARIPAAVRRELKTKKRDELFSLARLDFDKPLERCNTCHTDPHAGQFAERVAKSGCADCHKLSSFLSVKFDHDKESRFKLTGKHADVPCAGCHRAQDIPGKTSPVVIYRPLPMECSDCHRDVHMGQFQSAETGRTDCERCHTTKSFTDTLFEHNDKRFTKFALLGKHASVECKGCHPAVSIGPKEEVTRYKPLPQSCEDCHVDYHEGAFADLTMLDAPFGTKPKRAAPRPRAEEKSKNDGAAVRCSLCHTEDIWVESQYTAHDATALPLRGKHRETPCIGCHVTSFTDPMPSTCNACHHDAHAGEFGIYCASCHNEESWRTQFNADAHRRTGFPLVGRHAVIPCEECHSGARSRNFRGTTLECVDCHRRDYDNAGLKSVNHVASGLPTDCKTCHDAWRFSPGRFVGHDDCFQLSKGPHAILRCNECHKTLQGATISGACSTFTAACSACHTHACNITDGLHQAVPGYQCQDRKCYECHRFSNK